MSGQQAQQLTAQGLFPHGIAGVIFDCDGVMIDSRTANNIYYNRVLAWFGLPPMTPEQEHYSFMATSEQALLHIVPPHLHHEIDYVIRNEVVYRRDITPLLRLQPGFMNFIGNLRSRGCAWPCTPTESSMEYKRFWTFFPCPPILILWSRRIQPHPSLRPRVRGTYAPRGNALRSRCFLLATASTTRRQPGGRA